MIDGAIHPGPAALGRGVVVAGGAPTPPGWEASPRVRVDESALLRPGEAVDRLHRHWLTRRPVVVELAVANEELRQAERCDEPVHSLRSDHELSRERLFFLVWANNYDARSGPPVWWWAHKAARLGAQLDPRADVTLPDGRPAWCDGGPRSPLAVGEAVVHRESIELGRLTVAGRGEPDDDDLTDDQRAAVVHPAGPARVVAPAGSGKTRVLAHRVRHLVEDRGVEAALVTAVAYNTRAAGELRDRLPPQLGVEIRTVHALGLDVLRDAARSTGTRAPTVLDERDVRSRLEPLAPVRPRANTDVLAPYLEGLARIRLGLRSPVAVEAEIGDAADLARVFGEYRDGLARDGVVDFDELVYGAAEVLLRDPEVRQGAQARRRHLLVDELQDLTPAYLLLLRLLAAPSYQVFGVGDEDQTIYGYAGATPAHLVDFDHWFPGAGHHVLGTNFRCPPAVVTAAGHLLTHNRDRIPKRIRPGRDDGAPVTVRLVPAADVGPTVAAAVRAHLDAGADPTSVAVLSRVNAALLPVQVLLTEAGVPCDRPLGPTALRRTGLRSALAYLRLATGPAELSAGDLDEILNRPSRRLSRRVRGLLRSRRSWRTAELRRRSGGLPGKEGERLRDLAQDLDALRARAVGADTEALLRYVRDGIGLGRAVDTLDRSKGDDGGHGDDLHALIAVAALHPAPDGFEPWLRSTLETPGGDDGVRLSTVHRVKGMEWDHVVVAPVDAGLLPHRLATDTEEERRILHVAITRARTDLLLVGDEAAPSPFLSELDADAPVTPPAPALTTVAPMASDGGRAPGRVAPPVEVAVGLELTLNGGFAGLIRDVDGADVVVALAGGGLTRVGLGETVTVDGALRTLVAAPPDDELAEALRAWRRQRAADDGVPAYVVLADAHLDDIARRRPTSADELIACHGIGPARLDRYGDDILALVDDLATGAGS